MTDKAILIQQFEFMRNMAELKALSRHSMQQPLNKLQYNRMLELKGMVGL